MDHIDQCYEVLGLKPSASIEEVKQAKRDLVKVWHPDRFPHDPRLQQMAQEKLKEINEAYEQLQSFYRSHRRRASGSKADQSLALRRGRYGDGSESLSPVDKPPETDVSPDTRWVAVIMVLLLARVLSSQIMAPAKDTAASLEETPPVAASQSPAVSSLGEYVPSQTEGKVQIQELPASFEESRNRHQDLREQSRTSWKPVVPSGYFGIGSTQDDVLAIQGEPPIRIGNTWHYKDFSIEFSGGRVSGYSNISKNLKVRILPRSDTSEAKSRGYFTIGSTKDEVLEIQGTPSSVTGNTWHYKDSSVDFYGDQVSGYSNISKNLKVRILPGNDTSEAKSRGYFTIGSTKDEVLEIQGTPSSVTGNTWHYGDSLVDFYRDRVSDYSNSSKNLKVRLKHPIELEAERKGSDETQLGKAKENSR